MKAKLFMMVGISGSGKSYVAELYKTLKNATIFSSDAIRKEIYGDENIQDNPEKVFNILHKRIKNNLQNGNNSIYDATNLSMKRRKAFLESLKNIDCEKICIIVATPFEKCVKQDLNRSRTVGEKVIKRQREQFQCPYFYEGWDQIIISNPNSEDILYLDNLVQELRKINHDNPHHDYTIGKHMLVAEEYCVQRAVFAQNRALDKDITDEDINFYSKERDNWLLCANVAKYHDIGKKATKIFQNAKGEVTDIAHYYGHQNVSSYEIISHMGGGIVNIPLNKTYEQYDFIQRWLVTAMLAGWHMEPFFRPKDSKSWKKFSNVIGEDFADLILRIHKADLNSH